MRQRTSVITVLILVSLLGMTAGTALVAEPEERSEESKTGFLIPSQCQPSDGAAAPDGPYDDWPAPHTTACALREACIASGYGLWVMEDDAFYRFDEAGQALALAYFRTTKRTSYNKVAIAGDFEDPESVEVFEMEPTD